MKQAEDTKTAELPGLARRGRRPAGERAMTPAERQKAYRNRLQAKKYEATTPEMSRVLLIDQLAAALRAIDANDEFAEGAGQVAEDTIVEIITRYALRAKRIGTAVNRAAAAAAQSR